MLETAWAGKRELLVLEKGLEDPGRDPPNLSPVNHLT